MKCLITSSSAWKEPHLIPLLLSAKICFSEPLLRRLGSSRFGFDCKNRGYARGLGRGSVAGVSALERDPGDLVADYHSAHSGPARSEEKACHSSGYM
jgi:hypothetical protein